MVQKPTKNVANQTNYFSALFDKFHIAAHDTIKDDLFGVLNSHSNITDFVFQLERGEKKGIYHFQVYVKTKGRLRPQTFERDLNERCYGYRARVKPCSRRGRQALHDYCMKEDTRVKGPWGKRDIYLGQDLECMDNPRPFQAECIDYVKSPGNDRQILYIYNRDGNNGKSKLHKYLVYHKLAKSVPLGNATQIKANIVAQGPAKCYLIDLPRTRGSTEKLGDLYSAIEKIKDGEVECGMYGKHLQLLMMPPKIIVFSNQPPIIQLLSRDRWNIKRITEDYKLTSEPETFETKNIL